MSKRSRFVCAAFAISLCANLSIAQSESAPFSSFGVGIKVSFLGFGAEAATPLAHRFNLRAGFNAFSYNRGFNKDGVAYAGQLNFRSGEAHLDWFPFGGSFHVSPGALIYNGHQILANFLKNGKKPDQQVTLLTPVAITKANLNDAERLGEVK